MATEILRQAVAEALPQGTSVNQATDVIAGIISPSADPIKDPAALEQPEARPRPVRKQAKEQVETPDEAPEEDLGAPDAPDTDVDEEAPVKADAETEQPVSEDDAEEIELEPAQLAALLGLDEQDLIIGDEGELAFRAKVDGEVQSVDLRNLRDSYQLTKTAQQRLTKLSEDKKAFEAQRDTTFQQLQQQTQQMAQSIATMESMYSAEWEGVDWQKLAAEDPGEFAVKRAQADDRLRRLQAHKAQYGQHVQQAQEAWQGQQQQTWQEGHQRLNEAMSGPEFAKAGAWNEESQQAVYKHMAAAGIPENILQTTPYWQAFLWARKAMLYDEMTTQAKTTAKKVARLPKITKPGAQKSKTQAKRSKLAEARTVQRKGGGSIQSTADRISAIIRGN